MRCPATILIGNSGEAGDLRRDRNSGVFQPIPRADHSIDAPVASTILEQAHSKLDDPVALGIGAGGLDIHDSGNELRVVVRRVVFGLRLQPTNDAVIAALDQRVRHLFKVGGHLLNYRRCGTAFRSTTGGHRRSNGVSLIWLAPATIADGDHVGWHIEDALSTPIGDRLIKMPELISFPREPTRREIATFSIIVARCGIPIERLRQPTIDDIHHANQRTGRKVPGPMTAELIVEDQPKPIIQIGPSRSAWRREPAASLDATSPAGLMHLASLEHQRLAHGCQREITFINHAERPQIPRVSVAGGLPRRDFRFGVFWFGRRRNGRLRLRGRFRRDVAAFPRGLRGSISGTMTPKFVAAISAASSILLNQRSKNGMPHAIIRGNNGRRHEVDFGDAPIRVEIHASDETIEIFVEADFETHAEERRRFVLLNIPRHLFSEASGKAARRPRLAKE